MTLQELHEKVRDRYYPTGSYPDLVTEYVWKEALQEALGKVLDVEELVTPENHSMNGRTIHDWEGKSLFQQGQTSMKHRTIQAISSLMSKED